MAETARTTQTRIIPHRYAVTLRSIWGRIGNRPAMRDGTTGYEWHKGILSRCQVHLLRDTEESSMENELGSPQYDRHRMMLSVYRDAKQVREQVERLAGGPLRCAGHLGIIARIDRLAGFIDARIDQLAGRVRMIIDSFPADGVTTTIISNALPNMFTAPRVPGMSYNNNDTERSVRDLVVVEDRRRVGFPRLEGSPQFFHPQNVRGHLREERHIRLPGHHPDGARSNPEHLYRRKYSRPSSGEARRPRTSRRHPRNPTRPSRVSFPEPTRTADGSLPDGLG